MHDTLRTSRDPADVRRGRRWVAYHLEAERLLPPEQIELVVTMTSELVTNVLRHTASEPEVTLRTDDHVLVVEVHDRDQRLPMLGDASDGETGRGLLIVDAGAHEWGVEPRGPNGKAVWFSVLLEPRGGEG
ncbi:MAG: ATP-binding protein [Acidimicrobiales bacterium]|nr:ATP-binding protein [Actinomycetota bacterium]